MDHGQMWATK